MLVPDDGLDSLLAEQIAYYRARSDAYDSTGVMGAEQDGRWLLSGIAAATTGRQEADERCDDGEATYVDERLRVQVLILVSLPRTSSSPTKARSCGGFSRASRVDSATRIDRPVVFVIASRRDAVFTVSP
jgi:hypothetical protein